MTKQFVLLRALSRCLAERRALPGSCKQAQHTSLLLLSLAESENVAEDGSLSISLLAFQNDFPPASTEACLKALAGQGLVVSYLPESIIQAEKPSPASLVAHIRNNAEYRYSVQRYRITADGWRQVARYLAMPLDALGQLGYGPMASDAG